MSHKGNCHSQVKNNSSLKPFCKTLVKLLCSLCYECPCLPWTCLFICKSKEKTVMAPLPHPFLFLPLNQMSWNKCTAHFHDCLIKIAGVTKIVDLCSVLQMLAAEWSQNAETHIIIYDLKLFSLSTYSDICLHNIFKNKTQSKQWQRFISNTLSVPASIIRLRSIFTAICTYKNTIFLSPGEMAKELMAMISVKNYKYSCAKTNNQPRNFVLQEGVLQLNYIVFQSWSSEDSLVLETVDNRGNGTMIICV